MLDVKRVLRVMEEVGFDHDAEMASDACKVSKSWGEDFESEYARLLRLSMLTVWDWLYEGLMLGEVDERLKKVLRVIYVLIACSGEGKISKVIEVLEKGLYKMWENGFSEEEVKNLMKEIIDLASDILLKEVNLKKEVMN
jgi:hypothetical protein